MELIVSEELFCIVRNVVSFRYQGVDLICNVDEHW
jgi:hypothetical protein